VVHDLAWYAERQVDLRTGTPAVGLDPDRRLVHTAGESVPYDRLLLATGSTPRRLPELDEAGLPVHYLRTLDDATTLAGHLEGRILVVGAGWIGLEVAAAARIAGAEVTVVDPAEQPLRAVLGDRLGRVFADLHREHGVDLRLGTTVTGVETAGAEVTVRLSDGHALRPDRLVVGVGALPADSLAAEAGIATDGGVLVDARLRSGDPAVFAAGDVARHDHPLLGRLRVEHWDTALHQGQAAARVMLGGDEPYTRLPYFFTDQYDLGMEYVGHVPPGSDAEVVVRGDEAGRVLTAFWVAGSRVLAGLHLNDWDATEHLWALVGREVPVAALRDPEVSLTSLLG
jgi:NADPH-dependent 2,4-dienoyl-CoA reductase/sulfur reductase-like enzyme